MEFLFEGLGVWRGATAGRVVELETADVEGFLGGGEEVGCGGGVLEEEGKEEG